MSSMPNLKAVEFGFNKFCGPSVLSILTGRSTDECASVISQVNGMYDVRGVYTSHLLEAAKRMGFKNQDMGLNEVSLYRALVSIAPKDNGLYIVTVTGHFVCVEVSDGKIYFCDNHTKEPIPAASSARLAMNVVSVHKVLKDESFVEFVPKPKPVFETIVYHRCKECQYTAELPAHYNWCKWYGNNT